jgi:hypothetical protein
MNRPTSSTVTMALCRIDSSLVPAVCELHTTFRDRLACRRAQRAHLFLVQHIEGQRQAGSAPPFPTQADDAEGLAAQFPSRRGPRHRVAVEQQGPCLRYHPSSFPFGQHGRNWLTVFSPVVKTQ